MRLLGELIFWSYVVFVCTNKDSFFHYASACGIFFGIVGLILMLAAEFNILFWVVLFAWPVFFIIGPIIYNLIKYGTWYVKD